MSNALIRTNIPIDLLFTFEPTTTSGYMVSCVKITDRMFYREFYKKSSQYCFEGKDYKVYCLFNCSVIANEKSVLKFLSDYIEKHKTLLKRN